MTHLPPGDDISRMVIYGIDIETGARSEYRRVTTVGGQENWFLVECSEPKLESETKTDWKKEGF